MAQQDPFATPELEAGVFGGWIPTPPATYATVWRWPRAVRVPAGVLQNHDLRDYHGVSLFPPVGDQASIGSCAAWTFGYYLRAALASRWHVDNGTTPDLPDTLSPRFLYDLTRDGMGTYPQDSGSQMEIAARLLRDVGIAPERDCPYTGQADNGPIAETITPHMREAAAFYAVSGFYRMAGSGEQLLNSIVAALHEAQPVALAVLVPESFMHTPANGRVPNPGPNEQILGGHAICCVANFYDNSFGGGQALVFANSWGTGWGEGGFGYLPGTYATTRHAQYGPYLSEAWTCA